MTERQAGEKLQQIILELGFSLGLKLFSLDSNQSSIMFCFQGCLRGKGLSWRLQFKLFWFVSNRHLLCESSPIYKQVCNFRLIQILPSITKFWKQFSGKRLTLFWSWGSCCAVMVLARQTLHIFRPLPPPAPHFSPIFPSLLLSHFHGRLATLDAWTLDVPPHSLTPPDTQFNKVGKSWQFSVDPSSWSSQVEILSVCLSVGASMLFYIVLSTFPMKAGSCQTPHRWKEEDKKKKRQKRV